MRVRHKAITPTMREALRGFAHDTSWWCDQRTAEALIRRGLIVSTGWSAPNVPAYRITDAGRAALELK